MGRVSGKVIIVTGGSAGIGFGISRMLAAEGACVVLAGREPARGEEAAARIRADGGEARFICTDVSREEDCRELVRRTVEAYGPLTGLVNNAGIFPRATLEQTTEELWDRIMAVNLKGAFFCCKYAVPELRESGGGSIVNVGSINAYVGLPHLFAYSIAKGGLLTLTRNLANALAADRIRVNYLNPGWVMTETELETQRVEGHDQAWLNEVEKSMPLGRFQRPEDSGYAALYLLSDESEQVSGEQFGVDGRGCRWGSL